MKKIIISLTMLAFLSIPTLASAHPGHGHGHGHWHGHSNGHGHHHGRVINKGKVKWGKHDFYKWKTKRKGNRIIYKTRSCYGKHNCYNSRYVVKRHHHHR